MVCNSRLSLLIHGLLSVIFSICRQLVSVEKRNVLKVILPILVILKLILYFCDRSIVIHNKMLALGIPSICENKLI